MKLTPITERFILHWGEMSSRWGVNRTVAQIHALLFIIGQPLTAEDISETLNVARSNVSNSLRELANWNLIRTTHQIGNRRDHFETSNDIWELMRTIVRERKLREFDPTVRMLESLITAPQFQQEPLAQQKRVRETLTLMTSLASWTEDMLNLESSILGKLLKLGARIQLLLGKKIKKIESSTAP